MFPFVPVAAVVATVWVGRRLIRRKLEEMRSAPTRVWTRELDRAGSGKVTVTLDRDTGEWVVVGGDDRAATTDEQDQNQHRGHRHD